MRKELNVIVADVRGIKAFHFTDVLQVATSQNTIYEVSNGSSALDRVKDLWFPVSGDLLESVEIILVLHGIAHNVTSVDLVRSNGNSKDYKVVYNGL